MVITRSKKARRVLGSLSISQNEDQTLIPSSILLIKYTLLHSYRHCIHVNIKLFQRPNSPHYSDSYTELPKFLASQLLAQNIADGSRIWLQIAPIVKFIESQLPTVEESRRFPTLFIWHCQETHRSYLFFAFLAIKMESFVYTAKQLLSLRTPMTKGKVSDKLQKRLQNDLSLGL